MSEYYEKLIVKLLYTNNSKFIIFPFNNLEEIEENRKEKKEEEIRNLHDISQSHLRFRIFT